MYLSGYTHCCKGVKKVVTALSVGRAVGIGHTCAAKAQGFSHLSGPWRRGGNELHLCVVKVGPPQLLPISADEAARAGGTAPHCCLPSERCWPRDKGLHRKLEPSPPVEVVRGSQCLWNYLSFSVMYIRSRDSEAPDSGT